MSGIGNRFWRRASVAVTVAGMLLAGCNAAAGTSAPNTPKQLAADQATAKRVLLSAEDLPAGFGPVVQGDSKPKLPEAVERDLLACTHLPKRFIEYKSDEQPRAIAPHFMDGHFGVGPALEFQTTVEIDRSAEDIREPLSHLSGAAAATCFEPFFRLAVRQGLGGHPGITVGDITVRSLSLGSIGDQSAAFQGRVTLTAPHRTVDQDFDLYFVRAGRGLASMYAAGYDTLIDQRLAEALLSTMVARLEAAI